MTEYIQNNHFESEKPVGKPSVITWQGVRMVRSHSIQAVAREIVNVSTNQDMVSINAIGKQSFGKTELFRTLAHLIHKFSKTPFHVSFFDRHNIINLEETVKTLQPNVGHILIFDDIAFLKAQASTVTISKIEDTLSRIRHLEGGKDVKIILMKGFQYSKSISPFLRQNDMTFLASVDDSEMENYEKLIGKSKSTKSKIMQLKSMRARGAAEGKFIYEMGGGKKVIYKWKDPFLPFLYKTGFGTRIICSPLRTWIDPICNVCANSNNEPVDNDVDVKSVIADIENKFPEKTSFRTALKIKLIQQGINVFPPRIVQAVKYIDELQKKKLVSIDVLASHYDLTPTRTTLPFKKTEVST